MVGAMAIGTITDISYPVFAVNLKCVGVWPKLAPVIAKDRIIALTMMGLLAFNTMHPDPSIFIRCFYMLLYYNYIMPMFLGHF